MLKKSVFVVGCCVLSVVTSMGMASTMPSPRSTVKPLDRVVAIVNNDVVTETELRQSLDLARGRLKAAHMTVPPAANFRNSVLQQLINRSLQLQLAKRGEIKVTNKQVTQFMAQLAKQQHLSIAAWKQKMQKIGYGSATLRQAMREQLMINQVQGMAVGKKLQLSAQDIATVKDKVSAMQQQASMYHVVDYLVPVEDSATAAQKKQAERVAQRLTAALHKGALRSVPKGVEVNDMGWKNGNQIPELFLKAIQNQKPGAVSQPLVAGNGLHVLKLEGRRANPEANISNARIRQFAMQQKFVVALEAWIKTIRKGAYIKVVQ